MIGRSLLNVIVCLAGLIASPWADAARELGHRSVERFSGYTEWSLSAQGVRGNPFDLRASVIFTHRSSGETRVTEMFFDGDGAWKFRFAGVRPGPWTFRTHSGHGDLDGWSGTVTVTEATGPPSNGFLTARGSRWAWQGTGRVFVPQLVMIGGDDSEAGPALYDEPDEVDALVREFVRWHGFTGFHVNRLAGFWFDRDGDIAVHPYDRNPDPSTFEALELLTSRAHAAGAMVHIWVWGDEARGESPLALGGGINGRVDRRLQRYIAARLGPVPGWSMGYGFDLYEWVEEHELHAWHAFIQRRLGWFHFLGGRPQAPWSGTDHSAQRSWNRALSYSSYEHHRPTYDVYLAAMQDGLGQPVFSEDRFRVHPEAREKDYTEQETRRGLWRSTLAGGVANIWGQLQTSNRISNTGIYGNRQQLKTYATFFFDRHRFLPGMRRADGITDGLALATPDHANHVIYREGADSVRVDLSSASGPLAAVAVDTRRGYTEIDLGMLDAKVHTLRLGYASDWAIAVGEVAARGTERPLRELSAVAFTRAGAPVSIDVLEAFPAMAGGEADLHGFDPVSVHGGHVRLTGYGTLSYTPAPGHEGADSFSYTVSDATGTIHPGRAQVAIRADGTRTLTALLPLALVLFLAAALFQRLRRR